MNFDRRNKIIFVGTGGGGSMVGGQACSTGGMWWNIAGVDFFVDPGPGAIWHLRQSLKNLDLPLSKLRFVFISHGHLDHTNDLNALIEADFYEEVKLSPTQSILDVAKLKSRLVLLAPPQTLDPQIDSPIVTVFHRQMLSGIKLLAPRTVYQLGDLTLVTTSRLLEKPWYRKKVEEFGFWIKGEETSVGYLPETYWSPGLFAGFRPQILIYNATVWTRKEDRWAMIKTLVEINPELVVLRHWVKRSVEYGVDKIAQELQKESKIPIIAATDFAVFDLEKQRLIRFPEES